MLYSKFLDIVENLRQFRINLRYLGFDYLSSRIRSIKSSINWKRIKSMLVWLLWILFSLSAIGLVLMRLYPIEWVGFTSISNGVVTIKTLWDWMELLIIPIVLAVGGYFFRKSEIKQTRQQNIDDENERALNTYVGHVEGFISSKMKGIPQADRDILNVRTQFLLRKLDLERKSIVVKFLYGVSLITINNTIVDFSSSDLSYINVANEVFRGISLHGTKLDYGHLQESVLDNADLSHCSLVSAKFSYGNLQAANFENSTVRRADFYRVKAKQVIMIKAFAQNANFHGADLEGSRFRQAKLDRADFSNANLTGASFADADLRYANFTSASLIGANFRNANLMYANLRKTDLTRADFTNAIISENQIMKAAEARGIKKEGIKERPESIRILTRDEIKREGARLQLYSHHNIAGREEPGTFDLLENAEKTINAAAQGLTRVASVTESLGSFLRLNTEKLDQAEKDKIDNAGKRKLIDEVGNKLISYATAINEETATISNNMQTSFYDYGRFAVMEWEIKREKATVYAELREVVEKLLDSLDTTISQVYGMYAQTSKLPGRSTRLIKGQVQTREAISNLVDELVRVRNIGISTQSNLAQVYGE